MSEHIEHINIQGPDVIQENGIKYIYALISEPAVLYFNQAVRLIKQNDLLDQTDGNTKELQTELLANLKNCFKLFSAS